MIKNIEKKYDQKNRKYLQNIKTAKKIEKYKLKKIPHSKKSMNGNIRVVFARRRNDKLS
jgi:hypothetical protein